MHDDALRALYEPLPDGWTHTGATHCTHVSGAVVWMYGRAP